ncbi:hypothetical protein G6F62_015879 [Rhizopus arrhizus]|nr:hypothetical protein G6F62_015879 [Rhizopus arrhizus]
MQEADKGGSGDGQHAQRLGHALRHFHHRADARILGQVGVQFGLVDVLQPVHHMGAADALRGLPAGVRVAA